MSDEHVARRSEKGQFLKGEPSANPQGRPKGSRNRLAEAFLRDLTADWELHGAETIAEAREERRFDYLKLVSSLLPRNFNIRVTDIDELSEEQIDLELAALDALLEAAEAGAAAAEAQAFHVGPPLALPALPQAE